MAATNRATRGRWHPAISRMTAIAPAANAKRYIVLLPIARASSPRRSLRPPRARAELDGAVGIELELAGLVVRLERVRRLAISQDVVEIALPQIVRDGIHRGD